MFKALERATLTRRGVVAVCVNGDDASANRHEP